MKIETLKTNKKRIYFLCGFVCVVILLLVLITNNSLAKYRTTQSIPLINGTINYTPYDFKVIAMYQEENGTYKEIEEMPSSGYVINEEESYCTIDNVNEDTSSVLYTNSNGEHVIGNLKKNSKCYLYFDEQPILLADAIKRDNQINSGTPNFGSLATKDEGVYKTQDDWGDSYYFRGAVDNNWVKFAGYYWRIIRINGDGSIRLIYNGTSTATTGAGTQIGTNTFSIDSNTYNNNAYVGYMYTIGQVHGLGTNSGIKNTLDSWYQTNIANKGYGDKVSTEAGFCGDREPSTSKTTSNGQGGTGTTKTYYGGYIRLNINESPSLKCKNNEDMYTVSGSSRGNKALTNPVGLITADEVAMAGGVSGRSNKSYYLHTGQTYWTMSPSYFYATNSTAQVSRVHSGGILDSWSVDVTHGVRPVINIASNATIKSGNGTSSTPYEI
ncbi:unknown [Mycoplasma sp. CAG:776]|nr:unknown [Mycoplasma sp. CAG:776]